MTHLSPVQAFLSENKSHHLLFSLRMMMMTVKQPIPAEQSMRLADLTLHQPFSWWKVLINDGKSCSRICLFLHWQPLQLLHLASAKADLGNIQLHKKLDYTTNSPGLARSLDQACVTNMLVGICPCSLGGCSLKLRGETCRKAALFLESILLYYPCF